MGNNRISIWAALSLTMLATSVWAQPAPSPLASVALPVGPYIPSGQPLELKLDEAVALALRYNRHVRSAYLQRTVQRFDLRIAERAFVPRGEIGTEIAQRRTDGRVFDEISAQASASWATPLGGQVGFVWSRSEIRNGLGHETTGVSLVQPLLRGGGLAVNMAPVRIARLQEDINRLHLEATVSGSITSVITSYRNLVQAQEQVRLAEASLERMRELLATNRALIDAGRMAEADIIQTQSGVANQEVALLQTRQQLASAQLALVHLLALASRTNVVAVDDMQANKVDVDLERALVTAFSSRIDLQAQQIALEQARQFGVVARNARLWDVSLVASAMRDDGVGFWQSNERTDTSIGLRLSVPLGDLSGRQNWLTAQTNLKTAELALEELKQAVENQVLDAVQSVEASWHKVEAARRAKSLSEQALEIAHEKLRFGRASNFEVLSLQSDLRAADAQELAANIAYLNALTALDQQIGSTLSTWRISLHD